MLTLQELCLLANNRLVAFVKMAELGSDKLILLPTTAGKKFELVQNVIVVKVSIYISSIYLQLDDGGFVIFVFP